MQIIGIGYKKKSVSVDHYILYQIRTNVHKLQRKHI